jgi:hypothetical protein
VEFVLGTSLRISMCNELSFGVGGVTVWKQWDPMPGLRVLMVDARAVGCSVTIGVEDVTFPIPEGTVTTFNY